MKQFLFVLSVVLLTVACNSDKKAVDKADPKDAVVKSLTAPEDERAKKIEELKKLSPLTLEQMRLLLPHELDSVKEKNYLASTQFGYGIASVEYPKKSAGIKITLYDCAGEMGSPVYFENYWNSLNMDNDTEQGYTKTIDFMGDKAVEKYKKDINLSMLTFTVRGRLIVMMEGKNMKPEELLGKAKKLHAKIS